MQQFFTEGIPAGIIWLYVNHHPSQQLTRIKVLNETCINFHFFQVTLTQNKTAALNLDPTKASYRHQDPGHWYRFV